MELIGWSEKMNLQVREIDLAHRQILSLTEELHRLALAGGERSELLRMFNDLLAAVTSHFASEERMLEAHDYPGLTKQRQEHLSFLKRLRGLEAKVQKSAAGAAAAAESANNWMAQHITGPDAAYCEFLRSHGVK